MGARLTNPLKDEFVAVGPKPFGDLFDFFFDGGRPRARCFLIKFKVKLVKSGTYEGKC